ncbi:MAG TPA: hypothetical protein VJ991_00310 [Balneolales bacterium]|nr:hypothetical protein [Balneolales bacterium]
MSTLTATDYVWFIMIGLTVGWIFQLIFSEHGVSLFVNLATGVIAAIIGGIIFATVGLIGAEIYAFITAVLICFMMDMYYFHEGKHLHKK